MSDVSASSSILIFGYDENLLRTRRWLLEGQGYRVWTASSLMAAAQILGMEPVGLLILCQTISTTEYESAVELAQATQPEIRMLTMEPDRVKRAAGANAAILSGFPTPEALIAAVRTVTGQDRAPVR
ncbi:MAG: hypothetical protein ABI197_09300 [Granulicella sp.]